VWHWETTIPQLADVNEFTKSRTGFRMRPTAGLLSSRHFLNGLAFRLFFSTQYIRHHSVPFYTPEPDLVHELMGHAPLFADPDFADFSQEIGMASIGATDEQITALARCYWFTVEFGLCRQRGDLKIYGAGILSSFGEIEYSMGKNPDEKPEYREFDPLACAQEDFPITKYQPFYYIAESFIDAKHKMQAFADTMDKDFSVRWDVETRLLVTDRNVTRADRVIEAAQDVYSEDKNAYQ